MSGLTAYIFTQDMEATTGSWDMYGKDDKKRYPALQETFFNQATDILSRRESLRGFIALSELSCLKGATPSAKTPGSGVGQFTCMAAKMSPMIARGVQCHF